MTEYSYSKYRIQRRNFKPFICAALVIAAWCYVSEMDYQDAVASSHNCVYRGL